MKTSKLKYVDTAVTFAEVPDEITLCINISNCPVGCDKCHSSYLAQDIGKELNTEQLNDLIEHNVGITCVSFMGGDANPKAVNALAYNIKNRWPEMKTCWYSGRQELDPEIKLVNFSFIKLGPYEYDKGPLNSRTTNQRFYEVVRGNNTLELKDITSKFWK